MGKLREIRIPFTTDSSGDKVVYGPSVLARLIAVLYDWGDMAAGTDLDLTTDQFPVIETLFSKSNVGQADFIYFPRRLVQNNAGADLTGSAGGDREPYLIVGRPKLTVDEGGSVNSGVFILILEE